MHERITHKPSMKKLRTCFTTSRPSQTIATTGPELRKLIGTNMQHERMPAGASVTSSNASQDMNAQELVAVFSKFILS